MPYSTGRRFGPLPGSVQQLTGALAAWSFVRVVVLPERIQLFTCSTNKPFSRQYSFNWASLKEAVSITVASFASADHWSVLFGLGPGTARPRNRASLRQL